MTDWAYKTSIAGPPNVLTIGLVETLTPTEPAEVTITGETPNQILNFGIPQGYQGGSAGGENLGSGVGVYSGLHGTTGAFQFWTIRGGPNITATLDANGVLLDVIDGAGSGLDADTLDGLNSAYYLNYANLTNKPATFPPTLPIAWTDVSGKPATFPPTLPIAQTGVTNLVADLALKAPLADPVFTGDPRAPTPATSDNDTSIATTAFTKAAISAAGAVATVATSAPGSPVTGQIWWNSTLKELNIWSGTAWEKVQGVWG